MRTLREHQEGKVNMAKKKSNRLYLLVMDQDNIMKDYVWSTHDELQTYEEHGYMRLIRKEV